jgi:hypothetical protein
MHRKTLICEQMDRHQDQQQVEPTQCGCRAGYTSVIPLAWRFDAYMRPSFFNGRLKWPSLDEPRQNLYRVEVQLRRQQRLWRELPCGIADQRPSHRYWRHTRVTPHWGGGGDLDTAFSLAVPLGDRHCPPVNHRVSRQLRERLQSHLPCCAATCSASACVPALAHGALPQ